MTYIWGLTSGGMGIVLPFLTCSTTWSLDMSWKGTNIKTRNDIYRQTKEPKCSTILQRELKRNCMRHVATIDRKWLRKCLSKVHREDLSFLDTQLMARTSVHVCVCALYMHTEKNKHAISNYQLLPFISTNQKGIFLIAKEPLTI